VTTNQRGFTIIEVLMAVMVLGIGIVALASSSAMVTRMVGRGKSSTFSAQVAARRLENIRRIAASTSPLCSSANLTSGSNSTPEQGVTESWVVESGTTTMTRRVTVYVTYTAAGGDGSRIDTVSTIIPCAS
jgi:prepilin-type N-terminal cleavage/methylation domain-containing protein